MKGKLIDCYVTDRAVFYRLEQKLDMATILSHPVNSGESESETKKLWHNEQHWLADWGASNPIDGYTENCTVDFEIRSSRFYKSMKHGSTELKYIRNLMVDYIKLA